MSLSHVFLVLEAVRAEVSGEGDGGNTELQLVSPVQVMREEKGATADGHRGPFPDKGYI